VDRPFCIVRFQSTFSIKKLVVANDIVLISYTVLEYLFVKVSHDNRIGVIRHNAISSVGQGRIAVVVFGSARLDDIEQDNKNTKGPSPCVQGFRRGNVRSVKVQGQFRGDTIVP
jgi:hypothetical protein